MQAIETAIQPDDYGIRDKYLMFNRRYFGGELPDDLKLDFANLRNAQYAGGKGAFGLFHWARHPDSFDRVNPNVCMIQLDSAYEYSVGAYDRVLLHEMVHAYLFMVQHDLDMTDGGHHPRFWEKFHEVDAKARADGIEMPVSERADGKSTLEERAIGGRKSRISLAIYRKKDDPKGLLRYSPMLPGVFDSIVEDFQFKMATRVTDGENSVATRPQPGNWFYEVPLTTWPWYKEVDMDQGIELLQIEGSTLPFYFDTKGISTAQRFLGKTYWASNVNPVPEFKFNVQKVVRGKLKVSVKTSRPPYAPELIGAIEVARKRATGRAIIRHDGVYVNGTRIHTPAIVDKAERGIGAGDVVVGKRRTKHGAFISDFASDYGVPESFLNANASDTFLGIVFDPELDKLVSGEHTHGECRGLTIMYFKKDSDTLEYFNALTAACSFFNTLGEGWREKQGMDIATNVLTHVTATPYGIYSKLRFDNIIGTLEAALGVGKGTLLASLGAPVSSLNPMELRSFILDLVRRADPERVRQIYQYLGGESSQPDYLALVQDVFGCGTSTGEYNIAYSIGVSLSMLANQAPFDFIATYLLEKNPTYKYATTVSNSGVAANEYFEWVVRQLADFTANHSDNSLPDLAVAEVVKYNEAQAFLMPPESEAYKETRDQIRENYRANKGVLNRERYDTVNRALLALITKGNEEQRSMAAQAMADTKSHLEYYVDNYATHPKWEMAGDLLYQALEHCKFLTTLFGADDPFEAINKSSGSVRNAGLALYVFGGCYLQMQPMWRVEGMDIWERILATANATDGSVVSIDKRVTVPDIDEGLAGNEAYDRGYTTLPYEDLSIAVKQRILSDAGLPDNDIMDFFAGTMGQRLADRPLSELPEVYQQAFAGYKWMGGNYSQVTKRDVDDAFAKLDDTSSVLHSQWAKLWLTYREGQSVPAGEFWPDSPQAPFAQWVSVFQARRRKARDDAHAFKRQYDRANTFPLKPKFLNEDEEAIMGIFVSRGDPDAGLYLDEIPIYTNHFTDSSGIGQSTANINKRLLTDTLVSLMNKGVITKIQDVKSRPWISTSDLGAEWVRNKLNGDEPTTEPEKQSSNLPTGWTEATPGGMITNPDPVVGGIIDINLASQKWFVIFNDDRYDPIEGLASRDDAINSFLAVMLSKPEPEVEPEPEPEEEVKFDPKIWTRAELEEMGYAFTGLPPVDGEIPPFGLLQRYATRLEVDIKTIAFMKVGPTRWEVYYLPGQVSVTEPEEEEPVRTIDPGKPEDTQSEEPEDEEDESPERSVKAPRVKVADGKASWNITIGVNEKTKVMMFVPVEKAASNNLGIVRKREAKPIAAFLNYLFAEELKQITRQIKSGNRKIAAMHLRDIARSIVVYLNATIKERTPFPLKLAAHVDADWGEGLEGQRAYMRFLLGKTTTKKKLYHDVEKLKVLVGIVKPKPGSKEEAGYDLSPFVEAATENLVDNQELAGNEEASIRFEKVGTWGYKAYGGKHVFGNIARKNKEWHWEIRSNRNPDRIMESGITSTLADAKLDVIKELDNQDERIELYFPALKEEAASKQHTITGAETAGETTGVYGAFRFSETTKQNIAKWQRENNIETPLPIEKLHCTFMYTKTPLHEDWLPLGVLAKPIVVEPVNFKLAMFGPPGTEDTLVLTFDNPFLRARWLLARSRGADWTYASYIPHVTLAINATGLDVSSLTVPDFPLEIVEEYTEGLKDKANETAASKSEPFTTTNGRKYYGLSGLLNQRQIKALTKNRDYDIYISSAANNDYAKVLIREDEEWNRDFYSLKTYWVANQKQKYVMKFTMSPMGKLYSYTVYELRGNEMYHIKVVDDATAK